MIQIWFADLPLYELECTRRNASILNSNFTREIQQIAGFYYLINDSSL